MPASQTTGALRALHKFLPVCFILYVVSLATTMSGMEIFSTLLLVGVGLCLWLDRPAGFRFADLPFAAPIGLLVVAIAISILLSDASRAAKIYDLGRLRFYLVFAALWVYLRFYRRDAGPWLRTLTIVCSIIGVYGVVQHFIPLDLVRPAGKKAIMYAIPDEKLQPLVLGTFNHHLTFSSIYLFYAVIFLAVSVYAIPRSKYRLALSALLFLLCVWTESRMAWAAVVIVIPLTLIPYSRRWSVAALAGVVVLLGIFFATNRGTVERFTRTLHYEQNDAYTAAPRLRLWRLQIAMFKDHPVFGIGWNNNERHCVDYFAKVYPEGAPLFCGHAHNNFLQVLATTGIVGFFAFLWLWGAVFWRLIGAIRTAPEGSLDLAVALGVFVGLIGFQILGLTQFNFGDAEVTHNVMFFWAVAAALPVKERERAAKRAMPSHAAQPA